MKVELSTRDPNTGGVHWCPTQREVLLLGTFE